MLEPMFPFLPKVLFDSVMRQSYVAALNIKGDQASTNGTQYCLVRDEILIELRCSWLNRNGMLKLKHGEYRLCVNEP